MPELPEVETIVKQLNKKVVGLKIIDVWADQTKVVKGLSWDSFRREIKGQKILDARRRAKYIIIDLSGGKTLIIHQKISGHLLYGKWKIYPVKSRKAGTPEGLFDRVEVRPVVGGPIKTDPQNRFVRFILYLDNGYMLGLSDLRRFGKVLLVDTGKLNNLAEIKKLGPEPLDKSFTLKKFQELMAGKRGAAKKVLMDQFVIAGIGNIYSDEILWYAGIHPLKRVEKLSDKELAVIYKYIRFVLKKAISAKGDSKQDYRTLEGELGGYQNIQKAYGLTGEKCQKGDGGIIKRIKIQGRSAHFCPVHQK